MCGTDAAALRAVFTFFHVRPPHRSPAAAIAQRRAHLLLHGVDETRAAQRRKENRWKGRKYDRLTDHLFLASSSPLPSLHSLSVCMGIAFAGFVVRQTPEREGKENVKGSERTTALEGTGLTVCWPLPPSFPPSFPPSPPRHISVGCRFSPRGRSSWILLFALSPQHLPHSSVRAYA